MSAKLGNGNITFGDGTVQTTATPTVVSAFTNDSGYTTKAAMDTTYSKIGQTAYAFSWGGSGMALQMQWYDVNGTLMQSVAFNCNCNC